MKKQVIFNVILAFFLINKSWALDVKTVENVDLNAVKKDFAIDQNKLLYKGFNVGGGIAKGTVIPGSKITFNNKTFYADKSGNFIIGFERDMKGDQTLTFEFPDGRTSEYSLAISTREYKVSKIDGLPPSKVSTYTDEQLEKIKKDQELKFMARSKNIDQLMFDGTFISPLKSTITSPWGSQRVLNGMKKKPHYGLDLRGKTGDKIYAPADGMVKLANAEMYFEGGLILIDHGLGLESAFMHLSKINVKAGQTIKKGDIIGEVGSTGRSTAPHLHWGLKWFDVNIDPQIALNL